VKGGKIMSLHLLKGVKALPREDLESFIAERAKRIVEQTPGNGDAWDDPEEWQDEAVELAHAGIRFLR